MTDYDHFPGTGLTSLTSQICSNFIVINFQLKLGQLVFSLPTVFLGVAKCPYYLWYILTKLGSKWCAEWGRKAAGCARGTAGGEEGEWRGKEEQRKQSKQKMLETFHAKKQKKEVSWTVQNQLETQWFQRKRSPRRSCEAKGKIQQFKISVNLQNTDADGSTNIIVEKRSQSSSRW